MTYCTSGNAALEQGPIVAFGRWRWLNHKEYFRKKVENEMKWLFSKDLFRRNKLSDAILFQVFLRWFYGVWQWKRHVPFSNLSNFEAEILSGSFDSRHLSSTTAVHEGKAIPHSFTDIHSCHMNCYAIFWLLSSSFDHQPSCFASSSRSMSFNVDRYEPHLCGLLSCLWEKKWSSYFSSNDKHHMLPSSKPIL